MKIYATIAAVACVAAIALVTSASGATPPTTVNLVLHPAHFVFEDIAPKQGDQKPPTMGDTFVISGKLTSGGKAAGTSSIVCVTTVPGARGWSDCTGTATLSGGSITIAGLSRIGTNSDTYAITGGTGDYRDARGTVATKEGKRGTTTIVATID